MGYDRSEGTTRRVVAAACLSLDAAVEARVDQGETNVGFANGQLASRVQHCHAGRAACAAGGAVQFSGTDDHGAEPSFHAVHDLHRARDFAKRQMPPLRKFRMRKPQLLVGRSGDARSNRRQITGLVRSQRKSQALGCNQHKGIASKRGVHGQRPDAFHFQRSLQSIRKRGQVAHPDGLYTPVPARCPHLDHPARSLQFHEGFRFLHRHPSRF